MAEEELNIANINNSASDNQSTADEQAPAGGGSFDWGTIAKDGGALADNWKECLPEDLRQERCFDNIHTLPALFKSYASAQKLVGGNKVLVPSENSSAEEWDTFYRAGGRPEKMEDYKHDGVELPEGVTLDDQLLGDFRKFAFENGLSQKVYQAALAFDIQRVQNAAAADIAAHNAEYHETERKLKEEYGDRYNEAIGQYIKALDTFSVKELFEQKGLINNYALIKAFIDIGGKISESKFKGDDAAPVRTLADDLADAQADPAFRDRYAPGHDQAVKKVGRILAAMGQGK